MKKFIFCVLVVCMFCQNTLYALNTSLIVQKPQFQISVNDKNINNQRRYPFLLYKNIVYFPLTFSDAATMGLKTEWDAANKTLSINADLMACQNLDTQTQEDANIILERSNFSVVEPNFKIKINNRLIDNGLEDYPFFVYKDITYLPLTYHYVVDEFHWFSAFSEEGFAIRTGSPNNFNFLLEEESFNFENGQITYKKNDNVEYVYLSISYKEKNYNLTEDLMARLYPDHKNFGEILLNTFWLEPPSESENANKVPNQVDIYVQDSVVLIPLAQDINGVAQNSVLKINLETMEIVDIIQISIDEALNYKPQNYLN